MASFSDYPGRGDRNIDPSLGQVPVPTTRAGTLLKEDDWRSLDKLVKEVLPGFQQFIAAKEYVMSQNERWVCLLLRLHVKPLCICHLLGVSAAAVTMMSKSLLQKLFGCKGASRELSERLCEYE